MARALTDTSGAHLSSPAGMRAEFNANGSLRRFDFEAISLPLFIGNELEGGPTNLYLRHLSEPLECTPLLGPLSPTRFRTDASGAALVGQGVWRGIRYSITLVLAQSAPVWFWHVRLENTGPALRRVDLTYAQDLALAPYGAVRLNEYYVSQYIDHMPLSHVQQGWMVASRQNQAADGRYPWSLIGSLRSGAAFATDALQFHGLAGRVGDMPIGLAGELPNRRLQHEHSMVVIRDAPIDLQPQASLAAGFFGCYLADHPEASSASDLARVSAVRALPEAQASDPVAQTGDAAGSGNAHTLFSSASLLPVLALDAEALRGIFASQWRHEERDQRGELLAFNFGVDHHVVLRAKELRVLRPHGHMLRSGRHTTPDETALTSTVWMGGVFHSMLTQGHVSINRLLSSTHSYLGLFRSHGLRVFVELGSQWQLLGVPSAFDMSPDECRWIYRHQQGVIEVRAAGCADPKSLTLSLAVLAGTPIHWLVCQHVALNDDDGSTTGAARWWPDGAGISLAPAEGSELGRRFPNGRFYIGPLQGAGFERVGGDELLFKDGRSRQQPFVCIRIAATASAGLVIRGNLIPETARSPLRSDGASIACELKMTPAAAGGLSDQLARIAEIVPWFSHNALVHYLSPRGLEQYSGGGWGTRDVCQGPVELLLAFGRTQPVRDLLLRVMAMQNADGDWPQWFMFFERERGIRAGDSHGDIVFWPLLALAQYLIASGDAGVLDESLPFFDARGPDAGERASVWQHAQRALALVQRRRIPGTALAAYGHGDWNDALQPADPSMRDRMCSAWTVTLHYQTLTSLARALQGIGRVREADQFAQSAALVLRDFQRLLLVDGVLAGYALFEDGGRVRHLLYPHDQLTGVRFSALAIVHAILEDMLTPAQARTHLRLIDQHLQGPDGLRLFDRPMAYHGGPQQLFQRAESAAFFGREIGLMYMHAHLRYAQALWHVGAAERFFRALCLANPLGIRSLVPSATLRQSNCYYSSSDAAFHDRYEASAEYERVARGTVALDGGWRVYSSGAGIALGLIMRRFIGLSDEKHVLRVDPVMPRALDGLRVAMPLRARPIEIYYRIGAAGCGVTQLTLNGQSVPFTRDANPHRAGAALILMSTLLERLTSDRNALGIEIG